MNPERRDLVHPLEVIAAGVLGLLLVAALAVELWAGVAGALFGHGWVTLPLADMADVLGRLQQHLDDPRRAWPSRARARLPGAAGFYGSLALIVATVGAAGAFIASHVLQRVARQSRAARWARTRDLRYLTVGCPAAGRVTLGRHRNRLLAAEARQSVIVVAPTQTGKTTGLAVPALLEWNGPILATSVKNDLLRDTLACRARLGGGAHLRSDRDNRPGARGLDTAGGVW